MIRKFALLAGVFSLGLVGTIVAAFAQTAPPASDVVTATLDLVCSNSSAIKWALGALGTSFGASVIVALTKTPDPNTWTGKLYKGLELAALVVGRAKDVARPGLQSVTVILMLGLTGLAGCASAPAPVTGQPIAPVTGAIAPGPIQAALADAVRKVDLFLASPGAQNAYNGICGVYNATAGTLRVADGAVAIFEPAIAGVVTAILTVDDAICLGPPPADLDAAIAKVRTIGADIVKLAALVPPGA